MRELILTVPKDKRPSYLRIAQALRQAISMGQVRPGEILPSTRSLAQSLGVHRHTVMAALEELLSEGQVLSQERQCYQVNWELPDSFFSPALMEERRVAKGNPHAFRLVRRPLADSPQLFAGEELHFKYRFLSGSPDLRLFPGPEFRSFFAEALKRVPEKVLNYSDPAGHPPFVHELKIYLRRLRGITGREILVTHGSQEGIFLVAQALIKPGEVVAVEALGYRPAWEAFRAAGAKLVPIPLDSEGLNPNGLEKILRQKKVRLIYTTPLHQYPTTVTLPIGRRQRLYELAAKYHVPILEDDYDHEYHYRSRPLAPLASKDPAQLVIYLSSFSKVLFPAARLGFLALSAGPFFSTLSKFKRIMTRQNEVLTQEALARWMRDGGFERHLRRTRRVYEQRRKALLEGVAQAQAKKLPWICSPPDGGMAVWLDTQTDSFKLAQRAARAGVDVTPEVFFQLKKTGGTHLRLGLANQTPLEIQRGLEILMESH